MVEFIAFYSHVNYSVTKIGLIVCCYLLFFYSHVNYSVTKIRLVIVSDTAKLLQSRKLFSY